MSLKDLIAGRRAAKAEHDDEHDDEHEDMQDDAKAKDAKTAEKAKDDGGEKKEPEAEQKAEDGDEDGDKAKAATATAKVPADGPADPGTVAQLCAEAGLPKLAKPLIDGKLSLDQVKAELVRAGAIVGLAATFGARWPVVNRAVAEELAAKGLSLDAAKAAFFDLMVAGSEASPQVSTVQQPGGPHGADQGWDQAFAKTTGQGPAADAGGWGQAFGKAGIATRH